MCERMIFNMTNNNLIKFSSWLKKNNNKNLKLTICLLLVLELVALLIAHYMFDINLNWTEWEEESLLTFMLSLIVGIVATMAGAIHILSKEIIRLKNPKIPKKINLKDLIEQGEGTKREWKATARYSLRTKQSDGDLYYPIIKSICALANTDGGIILVGYDEDSKNFTGINNDGFGSNTDKWENWIRQKLDFHTKQQAVWVNGISFHYHHHNNVICAEIKIKKQNNPIECSGIGNNKSRLFTYVRAGAYTRILESPQEIINHFNNR